MEKDDISKWWKSDELVHVTLVWRTEDKPVYETVLGGNEAHALTTQYINHLKGRVQYLLRGQRQEYDVFELPDVLTVELAEVRKIHVNDGSGRSYEFDRYNYLSVDTPSRAWMSRHDLHLSSEQMNNPFGEYDGEQ